ncbi:MAG: PAS domain S-box protein [Terriglobales bacterium]|jgi:PAS domain S-box-containing protein
MEPNSPRTKAALPYSGFPLRIPVALRFLTAVVFSIAGLAATHTTAGLETDHFFLYLLLAVLGSAWVGGWLAGVLATGITAAAAFFWMYHPSHGSQDVTRFGTFIATCALLCWLSAVIESRRKTQISLQEDEERLRLALKAGDAWTWEWDPKTGIIRRSSEAQNVLGGGPATLSDALEHTLKTISELDRERVAEGLRRSVETGADFRQEVRFLIEDTIRWVDARATVIEDEDGNRKLLGMSVDITDRKRAEHASRRQAQIIDQTHDAVISADMRGAIRSWNRGAERIFQYKAEEVLGKNITILAMPEQEGFLRKKIAAAISAGSMQTELVTRRKSGEIANVHLSLSIMRGETGEPSGVVGVALDITDQKRAEALLRNTERMAAMGRLAATIAHEINNPLESVTNVFYLLAKHSSLDQTARTYLGIAEDELKRISHIVKQTLGFYRETERPVPVQLSTVLDSVFELYEHRGAKMGISLERKYEVDATVLGFPGELRQVFSNLVVNAMEAVGEDGRVRIRAYPSRDWRNGGQPGVRVIVADNGPGIATKNRTHLFEPFFTTKGERGTGLGLWVTLGMVQKHKGNIRVRSNTGQNHGTVFSVFLPKHDEAERDRHSQRVA